MPQREATEGPACDARRPEEPGGLFADVVHVGLDLHGSAVGPVLLQLAGSKPLGGLRESPDQPRVTDPRQLRERFREEIIARSNGDLPPIPGNGRRLTPAALGLVHYVVVDQGRRVQDLYGGRSHKQVVPIRLAHPGAQYQEQRPEPLATGCQSLHCRLDESIRSPLRNTREQVLDLFYGLEGPVRQAILQLRSVRIRAAGFHGGG